MENNTNITNEIISIIARRREEVPGYATTHEAYAILKDRQETLEKCLDFNKLMKEMWLAVKEGSFEAFVAYASQMETSARNAAVSAAELAAYAAAAARMWKENAYDQQILHRKRRPQRRILWQDRET